MLLDPMIFQKIRFVHISTIICKINSSYIWRNPILLIMKIMLIFFLILFEFIKSTKLALYTILSQLKRCVMVHHDTDNKYIFFINSYICLRIVWFYFCRIRIIWICITFGYIQFCCRILFFLIKNKQSSFCIV